jgi:hypothetical protein
MNSSLTGCGGSYSDDTSVAGPGCFIPDPDPTICSSHVPDPNIFSSRISDPDMKYGLKSYFSLVSYGFMSKVIVKKNPGYEIQDPGKIYPLS